MLGHHLSANYCCHFCWCNFLKMASKSSHRQCTFQLQMHIAKCRGTINQLKGISTKTKQQKKLTKNQNWRREIIVHARKKMQEKICSKKMEIFEKQFFHSILFFVVVFVDSLFFSWCDYARINDQVFWRRLTWLNAGDKLQAGDSVQATMTERQKIAVRLTHHSKISPKWLSRLQRLNWTNHKSLFSFSAWL